MSSKARRCSTRTTRPTAPRVDQAARLAQQAKDQLANLKAAGKPTEIAQAEANLADAVAARGKVQADLQRNEALLKTGAATAQTRRPGEGRPRLGRARRSPPPRPRCDRLRRRSAARRRSWRRLRRSTPPTRRWRRRAGGSPSARSPRRPPESSPTCWRGRARPSRPGAPVVSLLPPENIFVRFFVPEPALAHVHPGDTVALTCDNCPPDLDRRSVVHLAAGRIHAAVHLFANRRAPSSSSWPRRGRRRTRRRCSIPASR